MIGCLLLASLALWAGVYLAAGWTGVGLLAALSGAGLAVLAAPGALEEWRTWRLRRDVRHRIRAEQRANARLREELRRG